MTRYVLGMVCVLALGPVAWAGPAEMFEEKDKDFGVSPKGTVLVHYFRFTNNTKETITLGQPRVSCGCVTPALTTYKVAPGETAAVIAYMDTRRIPNAGVTKSVFVFVPFLTPQLEEVSLKVTTVTRDDLLMSPDVLAFGTVTKGKGAKTTTKVTFTSDGNWKIKKATSTGGFVAAKFKESSRNGTIVTYEVSAILDKDCPAGNWTSDIYLETSNAAVAKLSAHFNLCHRAEQGCGVTLAPAARSAARLPARAPAAGPHGSAPRSAPSAPPAWPPAHAAKCLDTFRCVCVHSLLGAHEQQLRIIFGWPH